MKLLSVILTLYLALLTTMPCADPLPGTHTCMEQAGHHDHEGVPDGCSPLCYCNCCQVPAVFHAFHIFHTVCITEVLGDLHRMQVPDSPVIPFFRPPQV